MPSYGARCCGVIRTGAKCKLSRVQPGKAILIAGPCKKCGERRCNTHCACGRGGKLAGRKQPRPKHSRAATPQPSQALSSTTAPGLTGAPWGRPASTWRGCCVPLSGLWRRYGRFHKEAVVVDSRVAYVGGANFTDQAVNYNGELVVRLVGPPVAETLTELEQCLAKPSTARGVA